MQLKQAVVRKEDLTIVMLLRQESWNSLNGEAANWVLPGLQLVHQVDLVTKAKNKFQRICGMMEIHHQ